MRLTDREQLFPETANWDAATRYAVIAAGKRIAALRGLPPLSAAQLAERSLEIGELDLEPSARVALAKAAQQACIETIGDLIDLMRDFGGGWRERLNGIGEEYGAAIADALGELRRRVAQDRG